MVLGWLWTCTAGEAASGGHAATTGLLTPTWIQALFERIVSRKIGFDLCIWCEGRISGVHVFWTWKDGIGALNTETCSCWSRPRGYQLEGNGDCSLAFWSLTLFCSGPFSWAPPHLQSPSNWTPAPPSCLHSAVMAWSPKRLPLSVTQCMVFPRCSCWCQLMKTCICAWPWLPSETWISSMIKKCLKGGEKKEM